MTFIISATTKENKEIKVKKTIAKISAKPQPTFQHYIKRIEAPAKKLAFL